MATAPKTAASRTAAPQTTSKTSSATAAKTSSTPQRRRSPKTQQEPKTMTEQTSQQSKTTTKQPAGNGKTATVNLPFVTAQFRRPEVHLPNRMPHVSMPHVSRPHVHVPGTGNLPSPTQTLYYGGLGALAVAGIVDWPVAAAIGAGTLVAQRARRPGGSQTAGTSQGSSKS